MFRSVLIPIISALMLSACSPSDWGLTPAERVRVELPDQVGSAEFQVYRGWSGGRYKLSVRTPWGEGTYDLWANWGPATRANLYVTPRSQLVVLGGGVVSVIVQLSPGQLPQKLNWGAADQLDSTRWRYVGAWDRTEGGYRFFLPNEMPECVALFGAGSISFRRAFQVEKAC